MEWWCKSGGRTTMGSNIERWCPDWGAELGRRHRKRSISRSNATPPSSSAVKTSASHRSSSNQNYSIIDDDMNELN